jgi:hypothetical protein
MKRKKDFLAANPHAQERPGEFIRNKPHNVVSMLTDSRGNAYYLVTFKPGSDRWYNPQWVWFIFAELFA